jgi:hypothetical protein
MRTFTQIVKLHANAHQLRLARFNATAYTTIFFVVFSAKNVQNLENGFHKPALHRASRNIKEIHGKYGRQKYGKPLTSEAAN